MKRVQAQMMDETFLSTQRALLRSRLRDDIIPFWLDHARDHEFGGYVTCLGRDGTPYEQNKVCMWNSGRIIWFFSHMYNELEPDPAWLEMARHGVEFALAHGVAPDGTMYYSLSRDGSPLQASQDVFTELFHVSGFSEFARATGDRALAERAWSLFCGVWERLQEPGRAAQPLLAETVPVRLFGHPLIALNVLDELRRFRQRPEIEAMIDQCLGWIFDYHVDADRKAALELVRWDGGPAPGYWGRKVTPGHMIEAGIFVIHEAEQRADAELTQRGLDLIEWGYERGWDRELGGIVNDIDIDGLPIPDMGVYLAHSKLWWQHAEALYALLLAYVLTGDDRFRNWYQDVRDYCFESFADPEHGEWFGVLDDRGTRLNDTKGSARKSVFHVGRNLFYCCRRLDRVLSA